MPLKAKGGVQEVIPGNPHKDSEYLTRIKNAIAEMKHHPRHHGVKMQAHHLISAEGVKRSGLKEYIKRFGYNINLLPNLVFIPCTLQGACYLGVQPHRGNHTYPIERPADQDHYDDDMEPEGYHDLVGRMVRDVERKIEKECPGAGKVKSQQVISEMNKLSEHILKLIQFSPNKAPLTKLAKYYTQGNEVGCGNVDFVNMHRGQKCSSERVHRGKQA